jgi:hypothetical protein
MAGSPDRVELIVSLLTQRGLADWAETFDDATFGATRGEIQMALRFHARQLLRTEHAKDAQLRALAQGIVIVADTALKNAGRRPQPPSAQRG